jgi:hypothetical protein
MPRHHASAARPRVHLQRCCACAGLVAALLITPLAARQERRNGPLETFVALAVNTTGVGPIGGGTILIEVVRWSTEEERVRAAGALRAKGPEGLLAELSSLEAVGTIRAPTGTGFPLKYAHATRLGNGRRIVIATERPFGQFDRPDPTGAQSYPFTVIELRLDADDRGDGRVALFARIGLNADDGALAVENYTEAPIRLASVAKTN